MNMHFLNTIKSKVILTCIVFSIIIVLIMNSIFSKAISKLEEELLADRLIADINYIEDIISRGKSAFWEIREDGLYYGDTFIGDGTEEKANFDPFVEHLYKTGTLAYVFMLDEDAELGYVEKNGKAAGYHQGRYLRIAGTTKDPNGNSIVGTYITKNVADQLDTNGSYEGEANVSGGMIYCYYKVLLNSKQETVGAVVVGRYITEIKQQISATVQNMSLTLLFAITLCCILIITFFTKWLNSITDITDYLKIIENGNIPQDKLILHSNDELSLIGESINKMAHSLNENAKLRKKSETDPLTGLPNRFSYEQISHRINNEFIPQYIAVEILDIDYFKEYNDNYGHQAGDKCIEAVSNEIIEMTKHHKNIYACRYGGDEFVIIYKGYSKEEVRNFVISLREKLIVINIWHDYSPIANTVTISQGICWGRFYENNTVEEFLHKADYALYEVKKANRNNFKIVEYNNAINLS